MHIQLINENKIKCTLTREELEDREITAREMEQRGERMWNLFREVIRQAEEEVDFRPNESPLKIEVMQSSEEMILVITKDSGEAKDPGEQLTENLAALFNSLAMRRAQTTDDKAGQQKTAKKPSQKPSQNGTKRVGAASAVFRFDGIEDVIRGARYIAPAYQGGSVLFRNHSENRYYLCLTRTGEDVAVFSKCCLALTEFGYEGDSADSSIAYMYEHYEVVLPEKAVAALAKL
jgi:adapter protein MecA 1/2